MHNKLLHLFPNYQEGDWVLHDEGAGPFIRHWNRPEPQPSNATINAVSGAQADRAHKVSAADRAADRINPTIKAVLDVLAPKLGMTPQALRQEVRQELKK